MWSPHIFIFPQRPSQWNNTDGDRVPFMKVDLPSTSWTKNWCAALITSFAYNESVGAVSTVTSTVSIEDNEHSEYPLLPHLFVPKGEMVLREERRGQ